MVVGARAWSRPSTPSSLLSVKQSHLRAGLGSLAPFSAVLVYVVQRTIRNASFIPVHQSCATAFAICHGSHIAGRMVDARPLPTF